MVLIDTGLPFYLSKMVALRGRPKSLCCLCGSLALLALVAASGDAWSQDRPPPDPAAGVPPIEPGLKGFGVMAVEGRTLQEMLARCRQTRTSAEGDDVTVAAARCDQLRRTLRNQPGNAAR